MYDIILTDRSYVPQGPVRGAKDVQFFRGLNKLATLQFTVPLEHTHEDRLAAVDGFIKLYRNKTLVYFGPLISAEEKAEREARSLALTSADGGWALSKRLSGKSAQGDVFALQGRHLIAKTLVNSANSEAETGVDTTNYTYSSGSSITYKAGPFANTLGCIQELGNALDGFDWVIRPAENFISAAVSGPKIASLQVATLIGANKPDAVFEYGQGTRSNVVSYSKSITRDQQATVVWHPGDNPGYAPYQVNFDAYNAWGRLEDAAAGQFTDTAMRQKLVDEHVRVRGFPRVLVRMTPHIESGNGRVPAPFVDYDVGDTIQFRAVHGGKVKFAGSLRVYGIRISVDEAGFERVELILEDEA